MGLGPIRTKGGGCFKMLGRQAVLPPVPQGEPQVVMDLCKIGFQGQGRLKSRHGPVFLSHGSENLPVGIVAVGPAGSGADGTLDHLQRQGPVSPPGGKAAAKNQGIGKIRVLIEYSPAQRLCPGKVSFPQGLVGQGQLVGQGLHGGLKRLLL